MENILWDEEKNNLLKQSRSISFERVAVLLEQKQVLDIIDHPDQAKYPGQKVAIVEMDGYAYLVPYVPHKDGIFLKTIIPSRKATKQYLERS